MHHGCHCFIMAPTSYKGFLTLCSIFSVHTAAILSLSSSHHHSIIIVMSLYHHCNHSVIIVSSLCHHHKLPPPPSILSTTKLHHNDNGDLVNHHEYGDDVVDDPGDGVVDDDLYGGNQTGRRWVFRCQSTNIHRLEVDWVLELRIAYCYWYWVLCTRQYSRTRSLGTSGLQFLAGGTHPNTWGLFLTALSLCDPSKDDQ